MAKAGRKVYSLGLLIALTVLLCGCAKDTPADPASAAESQAQSLPALVISELMPSNKSTLALADGSFPDWIELYNAGTEAAPLDGLVFSCGKKSSRLTAGTLEPGGYLLLPCDEASRLTLPKEGAELTLYSADGRVIDRVVYPETASDQSLCREKDGSVSVCVWPSPGFENSRAGYAQWQASRGGAELQINEVMVYDAWYLADAGGSVDWVELKNTSDRAIDLSAYALTDKSDRPLRAPLPAQTLAPGGILTLRCGGEEGLPLGLNAAGETLFLYRADGSLCDYACLHDIPLGASVGRMEGEGGFFYFAAPSPGAENAEGLRGVADSPAAAEPCGVFEGVEDVTVTLSAAGEIHYTLDGSVPTAASPRYTEPLRLTETTVIRAVNLEAELLPSQTLDLSYIINEGHTLPVVSVISDPEGIFGRGGIYSRPTDDRECPAYAALYDEGEEFALPCGIKIHGATSRITQLKKSWKLCFRPRYGGLLHDDLFANGVEEYSSILLRAAWESSISTNMRDILMHELAAQCSDSLPVQAYRFCVLYLNGEYWGLYALREAHSAEHYANHYGYDPETVTMWQGNWGTDDAAKELYTFLLTHDMRRAENYAWVTERLDVESVITWSIIESYSGNVDINSPNMRFYRSDEDGLMRYALVDLDLGFFNFGEANLAQRTGNPYSRVITLLLENADFRTLYLQRMSEYLHGPLSDEHFLALVKQLSDEQAAEIPRDYIRWGQKPSDWQKEINTYLVGSTRYTGGHAAIFANSARVSFHITPEEWKQYFADLASDSQKN